MIHIRGEGWKELKVGSVFDVEVRPTRDKDTGDWVELAHAVNNSYVAHLGGPVNFRPEWGHRFSAKMVHSHERRNGNSWE
jgi:hypothetical protein